MHVSPSCSRVADFLSFNVIDWREIYWNVGDLTLVIPQLILCDVQHMWDSGQEYSDIKKNEEKEEIKKIFVFSTTQQLRPVRRFYTVNNEMQSKSEYFVSPAGRVL